LVRILVRILVAVLTLSGVVLATAIMWQWLPHHEPARDLFIPIASEWDIKLKAIRQHRSQGRDTSENDQAMEGIARENGARVGVPMAEALRVLRPT
jgi:LmbE family N-acetylglucosaminyl deacetylase